MTKYNKTISKRMVILGFVVLVLISGFVMKDAIYSFGSHMVEELKMVDLNIDVGSVRDYFSKIINKNDNQTNVIATIGILSDSHGFNENIKKSLAEMKGSDVEMVIHLGDFTAGGEEESFAGAYKYLESSEIPYVVIPGDHDFNWIPEYSRLNYERYFGTSYSQLIDVGSIQLIMFDNSVDNEADNLEWLKETLRTDESKNIQIFFSAKPLYNPYFSNKNDPLGAEIIDMLVQHGIRYAVAGDTHVFAEYEDQTHSINMATIGAVGEYKAPLPQWVLMEVYEDGNVVFTPHPLADF